MVHGISSMEKVERHDGIEQGGSVKKHITAQHYKGACAARKLNNMQRYCQLNNTDGGTELILKVLLGSRGKTEGMLQVT